MRAYTWWFSARVDGNLVDSSPISTFKALLDSRKERQKECLAVADTITFACSDLSFTEPRTISVEGFVHGPDKIGECSLRQWLTLNHIPELKAIEFVAVFPGRRQLDQRYRTHTTIKKFLDETSLEPSADGKRVRFDFHGSSAEPERPHLEESVTWFLHARFRFAGDRSVLHVLADRDPRRETYLQAASLIAYACSDVSATGAMQVEILVHAKKKRNIRRGTLQSWLDIDDIQELEDLDIEPIRPGVTKSFMSHSTVQRFYAETVLAGDPAAAGAGKRIRVIHHGTEEVKKAGRPKGSTKEAMAAAKAAALGAAAPAIRAREAATAPCPPLPRAALPPTAAAAGGVVQEATMARPAPAATTSPPLQQPFTVTAAGGVAQGAATARPAPATSLPPRRPRQPAGLAAGGRGSGSAPLPPPESPSGLGPTAKRKMGATIRRLEAEIAGADHQVELVEAEVERRTKKIRRNCERRVAAAQRKADEATKKLHRARCLSLSLRVTAYRARQALYHIQMRRPHCRIVLAGGLGNSNGPARPARAHCGVGAALSALGGGAPARPGAVRAVLGPAGAGPGGAEMRRGICCGGVPRGGGVGSAAAGGPG